MVRSNIKNNKIFRILPRRNGEWISDKTRFFYDGIYRQRITEIISTTFNRIYKIDTIDTVKFIESGSNVLFTINKNAFFCLSSLHFIQNAFSKVYNGFFTISEIDSFNTKFDFRNSFYSNIDFNANFVLHICVDLKRVAPVFNEVCRSKFLNSVNYSVGVDINFNNVEFIGNVNVLNEIYSGTHKVLKSMLNSSSVQFIVYETNSNFTDIINCIRVMFERFRISFNVFYSNIEPKWQENLIGNIYIHNKLSNKMLFSSIASFCADNFNINKYYVFNEYIYFGSHARVDGFFNKFSSIFPIYSIFEEVKYNIDTFGDLYIQPRVSYVDYNSKIFSVRSFVYNLLVRQLSNFFFPNLIYNKFINFVSNYVFKIEQVKFLEFSNIFNPFYNYYVGSIKFNNINKFSNNRINYSIAYLSDDVSNASLILNVANKRFFNRVNNYSIRL